MWCCAFLYWLEENRLNTPCLPGRICGQYLRALVLCGDIGPAGTGKTESVKALGNQLGRFVLVFNCDETFDFQVWVAVFHWYLNWNWWSSVLYKEGRRRAFSCKMCIWKVDCKVLLVVSVMWSCPDSTYIQPVFLIETIIRAPIVHA